MGQLDRTYLIKLVRRFVSCQSTGYEPLVKLMGRKSKHNTWWHDKLVIETDIRVFGRREVRTTPWTFYYIYMLQGTLDLENETSVCMVCVDCFVISSLCGFLEDSSRVETFHSRVESTKMYFMGEAGRGWYNLTPYWIIKIRRDIHLYLI